jgi:hypothetical protein
LARLREWPARPAEAVADGFICQPEPLRGPQLVVDFRGREELDQVRMRVHVSRVPAERSRE